MKEDINSGRVRIGVACYIVCIALVLGLFMDISNSVYKEKTMLDDCNKYSTTMTITKKEITGAVKYRKCNLYVEYEGSEYRMQYVPVDTFNSYEKGDTIECVVYKDSEGEVVQVKALEDL